MGLSHALCHLRVTVLSHALCHPWVMGLSHALCHLRVTVPSQALCHLWVMGPSHDSRSHVSNTTSQVTSHKSAIQQKWVKRSTIPRLACSNHSDTCITTHATLSEWHIKHGSTTRVDGPSWRAVNSCRQLGAWTRVVETRDTSESCNSSSTWLTSLHDSLVVSHVDQLFYILY